MSHLPVHAGFDLDAIRKVLGEAKPEEMKIQNPPQPTSFSPPRPDSAPPGQRISDSPASSSSSPRLPNGTLRDPISNRLAASFNRTMSLDGVHHDQDDSDDEYPYAQRSTYLTSSLAQSSHDLEDTSFVTTPKISHRPMPFASDATLSWKAEPEEFYTGVASPYGLSRPSASPFTDYSLASQNPFSSPPPDAGLSFGGVDGSITSMSPHADPWQVPGDIAKKSPSFNPNPWT